MTDAYKITLRNILYLCKFIGIINMSYILESDGLLIHSTKIIYKCLDFIRIIIFIIFTYFVHMNVIFIEKIYLFKFWSVIIASRISETWVIQLMNGVIEYDQKVTSFPRFLFIRQHSQKTNYWNIIFIFTLIYHIAITLLFVYLWPPMTIDITSIVLYFIRIDFIVDVTVIFSSYFYLQQLEFRFQTLNDSWEFLLPGFLADPGELTHSITGMTLDKIRLLHAELSDLLRIFSVGYGQILLGFFVFSYINMLISFFYSIHFNYTLRRELVFINFLKNLVPYIFGLQNVIFILFITIAASRVYEKKRKMISHLRLLRISNLSANLKTQVKLFLNQISVFESSEITAFGIFSINLNLVTSILILLVNGLVALIQLREHPTIMHSHQQIQKFINSFNNETFT